MYDQASVRDDDSDDEEMYEETALEGYNTPLDDEDGPFDDGIHALQKHPDKWVHGWVKKNTVI